MNEFILDESRKKSSPATSRVYSAFQQFSARFLWLFILIAICETYEPWTAIPWLGSLLSSLLVAPFAKTAQWAGATFFHLSGIAATPHPTDSRDTALGWLSVLIVVVVSLVASALWSVLDRKQKKRESEIVWMRYILRMMLVFIMLRYGIFKIFPLQMSPPSLAVLNEPLGQSSPMTLLWTTIGLRPSYQIISGVLEAASGILLFFRRTALIGTLVGLAVMANVVLLNFCFDIPVKLGATLIFLAFAVLLLPDLQTLLRFFLNRAPSQLTSQWRPACNAPALAWAASGLEWVYLFLALLFFVPSGYRAAKEQTANQLHPSLLTGEWRVDSSTINANGNSVLAPVLTAEGSPMTSLYLEPDGQVMARSQDGRLWRAGAVIDPQKHSLSLFSGYFEGTRFNVDYTYSQPDSDHLQLEPSDKSKSSECTLLLTRIPLPASYPLLNTPFKWVEEWALER